MTPPLLQRRCFRVYKHHNSRHTMPSSHIRSLLLPFALRLLPSPTRLSRPRYSPSVPLLCCCGDAALLLHPLLLLFHSVLSIRTFLALSLDATSVFYPGTKHHLQCVLSVPSRVVVLLFLSLRPIRCCRRPLLCLLIRMVTVLLPGYTELLFLRLPLLLKLPFLSSALPLLLLTRFHVTLVLPQHKPRYPSRCPLPLLHHCGSAA